jgi:hypothetical protein
MISLELTDAMKDNVQPDTHLACYYCLNRELSGKDIVEYTGGRAASAIQVFE